MVETANKVTTGLFRYKLFLPQASSDEEEEFDKLSLLNLTPVKIVSFVDNCGALRAFAPVGDDKVLLLSASEDSRNKLQAALIATKLDRDPLANQSFDLREFLDDNHALELLLKDHNTAYFAAHSSCDFGNQNGMCAVKKVLLVQARMEGNTIGLK
jgi:hypothetical protein